MFFYGLKKRKKRAQTGRSGNGLLLMKAEAPLFVCLSAHFKNCKFKAVFIVEVEIGRDKSLYPSTLHHIYQIRKIQNLVFFEQRKHRITAFNRPECSIPLPRPLLWIPERIDNFHTTQWRSWHSMRCSLYLDNCKRTILSFLTVFLLVWPCSACICIIISKFISENIDVLWIL